jgi:hypothetical protein
VSHFQRVKYIHRDLIIADQWTESHSPWQNPTKLNGVKYFKSHAHVLLDWTGALNNLWFLEQDYHQLNCKIPEQLSKGGTPDISHILMFVLV